MSRGGTSFCTASTRDCMHSPSPMPSSSMMPITESMGVSVPIWPNMNSAATITPMPMIGKIL